MPPPSPPTGEAPRRGLSWDEARRLLASAGPNEIRRDEGQHPVKVLLAQFASPLVWLLLAACALAAVMGEVADAVAIGAILAINAVVGFAQEYRAERALLALRSMTSPRARVVRDGKSSMIPAAEVVPGDLLLLEAGDVVAADARLLEANVLSTGEAALTGESTPVEKGAEPVPAGTPLALRADHVFMGTTVATGSAAAQVVATGMGTELGKIAGLLATAEEGPTPLQRRLAVVSRSLVWICLAVVAVVAGLLLFQRRPLLEVFLSSISLAVAVVPEGLPAIVTIALAIGVQRMARQHVLVRRLHAVETLGSLTVVCTDKTGTLTSGVMEVREVWGQDEAAVLRAAAACSDAELDPAGGPGVGDPTELALLRAAARRGLSREEIERAAPRVEVHPFDSSRKMMSIRRADGVLYVKGAAESVLSRCASVLPGAAAASEAMAGRALRVLAVARGSGGEESGLTLLGLVGIADPPRREVLAAVAQAREAGVRPVMITGDHPATARAIATELGILRPGDRPEEVVHARVTAEDKIHIVRAWKQRGAVVAMTGDGVNDAPALREAHVGVAMGRTGTEVTREASDVVLTDDNFASIVAGIREGRGIYQNIRKSLVYLLVGNAGELVVMLGAALLGLPLPLLPLMLLWINLVTDGLPGLALVMDPAGEDLLKRPPRDPKEPILGRRQWLEVGGLGLVEGLLSLGTFLWADPSADLARARTMAFTTLVLAQLFRVFSARSERLIFWEVGALTNLLLVGVVAGTTALQLLLLRIPATQRLFQVVPLSLPDLLVTVLVGLSLVTAIEVSKLLRRALARG